jgi:hypothetical protein
MGSGNVSTEGTREEPGRNMVEQNGYPRCLKCEKGILLPLSDYGRDGAPIRYKAWVCSSPECGFNIRIDNGEISIGRTIGQSLK